MRAIRKRRRRSQRTSMHHRKLRVITRVRSVRRATTAHSIRYFVMCTAALDRAATIKLTVQHKAAGTTAGAAPKASASGELPPKFGRQISSVQRRERGMEVTEPSHSPLSVGDEYVDHDLDDHAIHYDKLGYVLSFLLSLV